MPHDPVATSKDGDKSVAGNTAVPWARSPATINSTRVVGIDPGIRSIITVTTMGELMLLDRLQLKALGPVRIYRHYADPKP